MSEDHSALVQNDSFSQDLAGTRVEIVRFAGTNLG